MSTPTFAPRVNQLFSRSVFNFAPYLIGFDGSGATSIEPPRHDIRGRFKKRVNLILEVLVPAAWRFDPHLSSVWIGDQPASDHSLVNSPFIVVQESPSILKVYVLENAEIVILVAPELVFFQTTKLGSACPLIQSLRDNLIVDAKRKVIQALIGYAFTR